MARRVSKALLESMAKKEATVLKVPRVLLETREILVPKASRVTPVTTALRVRRV